MVFRRITSVWDSNSRNYNLTNFRAAFRLSKFSQNLQLNLRLPRTKSANKKSMRNQMSSLPFSTLIRWRQKSIKLQRGPKKLSIRTTLSTQPINNFKPSILNNRKSLCSKLPNPSQDSKRQLWLTTLMHFPCKRRRLSNRQSSTLVVSNRSISLQRMTRLCSIMRKASRLLR